MKDIVDLNSLDIINHLKKGNLTNPKILDATYKIIQLLPDAREDELYMDARVINLLNVNKDNLVLCIGTHSKVLYSLLGEMTKSVFCTGKDYDQVSFTVSSAKQLGYENLHAVPKIESGHTFDKILIDQSQNPEPKEYINMLKTGGSIIILDLPNKNNFVKITKTNNGYFNEEYSTAYLKLIT